MDKYIDFIKEPETGEIDYEKLFDALNAAKGKIRDWCNKYGYDWAADIKCEGINPENFVLADNLFDEGVMEMLEDEFGSCAASIFPYEYYESWIGDGFADYFNEVFPLEENRWVCCDGKIVKGFKEVELDKWLDSLGQD